MSDRSAREPWHLPEATYRLQLNEDLPLRRVISLVPYLHRLGISTLYLSPVLMARPGSTHGYDVTAHDRLNPEIGTMEDLEALAAELDRRGMAIFLDIVPNHMCVSHSSNAWWWDVLENGPSSPFSGYFDIDWNPPKPELAGKILLPILGAQYGDVLEAGELRAAYSSGAFTISYWETSFPAAPRSWPIVLEPVLARLREDPGDDATAVTELESILTALSYLPPRTETDPGRLRERFREKEVVKRRLDGLCSASPAVLGAIQAELAVINGTPGSPSSFDRLDRFLSGQAYRLSFWQVAADEINYRRFFDINELAAIRVEDDGVFRKVHELPFDLVRRGIVKGFRVDHPDGLFQPARYFSRIQDHCRDAAGRPVFVAAEKILIGSEQLRPWEIQGTTGYGFLNLLNGLFVSPSHRRKFARRYRALSGFQGAPGALLDECRRLVLRASMSSELTMLARQLDVMSEQHRRYRDFTLESLREALREIIVAFPVYRTYVSPDGPATGEDLRHIDSAISTAASRNPSISGQIFDFIRSLMVQDPLPPGAPAGAESTTFAMRLQQITGLIMAKSLEDTAHYRYHPLASLNEVGSELGSWSVSPLEFHRKARVRERSWPHAMLATSTHDTKRAEDVRARLNVLSEIPDAWFDSVRRWRSLNAKHRRLRRNAHVPSVNEEYLLYQTLLGTWPRGTPSGEYRERIRRYFGKVLREAKVHSSWTSPKPAYESEVSAFIDSVLDPVRSATFLADFSAFTARVSRLGFYNSLSQVLLKIASPGVPDFYQGSELWNLRLVDPDNREPVDFAPLCAMLREMEQLPEDRLGDSLRSWLDSPEDGRIKLWVTRRLLAFRRAQGGLFARGRYIPLRLGGERRKHCIAFARQFGSSVAIAAASRFFAGLPSPQSPPTGPEVWGGTFIAWNTRLPSGPFRDVITGRLIHPRDGGIPLSSLFTDLPIAMVTGEMA